MRDYLEYTLSHPRIAKSRRPAPQRASMAVFEREAREATRIAEITGVPRDESWAMSTLF